MTTYTKWENYFFLNFRIFSPFLFSAFLGPQWRPLHVSSSSMNHKASIQVLTNCRKRISCHSHSRSPPHSLLLSALCPSTPPSPGAPKRVSQIVKKIFYLFFFFLPSFPFLRRSWLLLRIIFLPMNILSARVTTLVVVASLY